MNESRKIIKCFSAVSVALAMLPHAAYAALSAHDRMYAYTEAEVDYADADGGTLRWDAEAWAGGDYNKVWLTTAGERANDTTEHADVQLFFGRFLADYWDLRLGLRHDFDPVTTNYLAIGIKGLAPYYFETDATAYLSEEGDISARLSTEADLLLTQRLIAQPYVEAEFYGQDVTEAGKGAGLTEADLGVRLRYEIVREFAPYIGIGYSRLFGETADFAEAAGRETADVVVRLGLRGWY